MTLACLSFFPGLCGPPPCKNDPKLTPKDGKLIFGFGQKWSRGGPKVVLDRWFLVSQQNHVVPAGTCFSARIMILFQDHDPLPGSSSSASIIILCKHHHPLPGSSSSSKKVAGSWFCSHKQISRCHIGIYIDF